MTLTIRDVESVICTRFQISREDLRGPGRYRAVARPRQIAMFLAREITGQSLPRIGHHFSRDHTTVLYAVRHVNELLARDQTVAGDVAGCRELIARVVPWKALAREEFAIEAAQ